MNDELDLSQELQAGAAGFLLGGLAGLSGGIFGLTGLVPALILGMICATTGIELVRGRDANDLRSTGFGALLGGSAAGLASVLAREPLDHALTLTANYAVMGGLAGAWYRRARWQTWAGALVGSIVGGLLALTSGRLHAGHTGVELGGPLAIPLQMLLGAVTGGMAGTWLKQAGKRPQTVERTSDTERPEWDTIHSDEDATTNSPTDNSSSAGSDRQRL